MLPHSFGFRRSVDLDKLNQVADDLEADGYAASTAKVRGSARRQPARSVT